MPACRLCLLAAGLLLGLLLFIPVSATGTGAEKPGVCPQLEPITDCVKKCTLDKDCPDNYKCCQAGCSSVCSKPNGLSEGKLSRTGTGTGPTTQSAGLARTSPLSRGQVSTKPPVVTREGGNGEKQGTCPSVDLPKLGLCEDQCQVDSQCSGNMKCCRNGCGKMGCATPEF